MRWCLRVCEDWTTGAAGYSIDLTADSRGAGADENRGARTHLTSSSFRAFRFATRCPGGRRSRCSSSPLLKPSSTTGQRQRKEKQLNATTTPTPSAPSATGQQLEKSQKSIACPKASPNRRLHRSADPRRAEGRCTGARQRFSLWTVHGPFLFWQDKREMGGASPLNKPPCGSRSPPGRRSAAPPTQQRVHLPSHPNDRISPAADSRPISQKRKNHTPCRTSSNNWHLN